MDLFFLFNITFDFLIYLYYFLLSSFELAYFHFIWRVYWFIFFRHAFSFVYFNSLLVFFFLFFFWHMMAKFVKCLQALSETPEDYEALVRTPKPPQPHSFCALLLLLHDWQWRLPTHCPQGLLGNRKRIRGFPFLCCMSFFFSFFSLPGHSLAFHAKDDQDLFLSLTARMIDHLPIGRWMKCWWSCHRCSGWHWAWVLPYRADFSHLGNNFHCLSSALSSSSFHTI